MIDFQSSAGKRGAHASRRALSSLRLRASAVQKRRFCQTNPISFISTYRPMINKVFSKFNPNPPFNSTQPKKLSLLMPPFPPFASVQKSPSSAVSNQNQTESDRKNEFNP
jgi:hypothetical protein